jgi:hypothetical protein
MLRPSDGFLIPFSLMWGGFAFFWELSVLRTGLMPFALFGIPFVLVGLYLIVGRFWVDARARSSTVYAITDRRILIISGVDGRKSQTIPLSTMTNVELRRTSDGRGTITLGKPNPWFAMYAGFHWPGSSRYQIPQFEQIANAEDVHTYLLDAIQASQE